MSVADDLSCREVVELVTDWLEGALSPVDHARVELHLAGCEGCVAYVEQIRETVRVTGRLRGAPTAAGGWSGDVDQAARDALVAAFRGWRAGGVAESG